MGKYYGKGTKGSTMKKYDICMIVRNTAVNDIRVMKEARTLRDAGYSIAIIGYANCSDINCDNIDIYYAPISILEQIYNKFNKIFKKKKVQSHNIIHHTSGFISNSKAIIVKLVKAFYVDYTIRYAGKSIFRTVKNKGIHTRVYHAHDLDVLRVACNLAIYDNNSKLVYDAHEIWTEMTGINPYIRNKYSRQLSNLFPSCTHLIYVSNYQERFYKCNFHYECCSTLVMNAYDGVCNEFHPTDKRKIQFVYIGFYLPGRGIDEEIEAFANSKCSNMHFTLYLNKSGATQSLIEKLKHDNKYNRITVNMFVPQDRVVPELAKYDIGVISYRAVSENAKASLPNKLFQYMAAGLAVMTRDLPEISNIVHNYKIGNVYNDDNIENIIAEFCSSPQTIDRYKHQSLELARNEYSWKYNADRLANLYKSLLS